MKLTTRFLPPIFVFILPLYIVSGGCKAGRPARATLPDQLDNRGISEKSMEGTDAVSNADIYVLAGLPFYAVDTTVNGKEFTAIYLRNPEFDSLAFSIVKSYEPFTNSVLKIISSQGIKGVLIDFRQSKDSKQGEAKFSVANYNGQELEDTKAGSLSIVFLWDQFSASRAAGFMNELSNSSQLTVKTLSNTGVFSPAYRQDCFRPGTLNFDEE